MSLPPLLQCEKLTRRLEGDVPVTLVRDISLSIAAGECVAIVGPSGSGKSSLLYLLGLLDRQTAGEIWLEGVSTSPLHDDALAAMRLAKLGFIFQFHFLLPEFTALENVMLPMRRLGQKSESAMREHGLALLADLGLEGQENKRPKQLSGGQCQRVAIARALANDPLLLLGDEPTGNLDTASSENVQTILRDLAHKQNRGVLVVTHDPHFAQTADRVITLVDGLLVSASQG